MKVLVVGTGGVGGYFGGKLARAGNDVTFLARGEHYEAIKKRGLTVKSDEGDFTVFPANVVKDLSKIKNPEFVIFAVKTYDTEEAAEQLSKVVAMDSVVVSLQNGVDNDNVVKKYVKAKVLPGLAYVISTKIAPGYTWTPAWEGTPDKRQNTILETTVIDRFIEPEEIAQVAVMLGKNDAFAGEILLVDGGVSLNRMS